MASLYQKYGQSISGVDLYWTITLPVGAPGQKFPFCIGLHAGGFLGGSAVLDQQARTCVPNGIAFCGTEYRLAPPGTEMNSSSVIPGFTSGNHPHQAQNDQGDHGYAPEAIADVAMAVRAARAHPLCDGRVFGLGGSAGAALVIYNLLTATEGDDKFDYGVSCSIGVFDMYRSEIWSIPTITGTTVPHEALANWLNITDTFPAAPTGADLVIAKNNCCSFNFNAAKIGGKIWVLTTNRDSPGIPTSTGIEQWSYTKAGAQAVNESVAGGRTVDTGFLRMAIAAGMSESTADVPEPGLKYKFTNVDAFGQGQHHSHAFNSWPLLIDGTRTVGQAICDWFNGSVAQTGGEPSVTSFAPPNGFAGVTEVVITGENFGGAQGVRFNHEDALSYVVNSSTQITAIPPIGATSGLITVRTPVDTVNSDTPFTVDERTVETDPTLGIRTPILDYPIGGQPPVPPSRPSPPRSVDAHASGVAGSHAGEATWLPPEDTSGATLLPYTAYLTSDAGTGDVPFPPPGSSTDTELENLAVETEYDFHIAANTIYGQSDEVVVHFTSNPANQASVKDQPRGSLFLFDSPVNPITGKHETNYNPTGFWGNPQLAGSRYRSSWDTIATNPLDPTDTTYLDWTDIDAYLAKCVTYNQFAGISFAAGIYCPPWIINNPRIKTIDQSGPDAGIMPIPWNQLYLDLWIAFIEAFATRYDAHPQLSYFVVGGLGQVVETILAQDAVNDLPALLSDAQLRGFGTIEEAWMFAVNRILFACAQVFKHTHFLVSLARIVPDSWAGGGEGSLSCFDCFEAGRQISLTNFGVMNAGLNENSNASGGFAPNVIIHDNSQDVACGFQFGHTSNGDEVIFNETMVAGATTLKGKFLELYKDDARANGGDPTYQADIDAANIVMDANP